MRGWHGAAAPPDPVFGPGDWGRIVGRGAVLATVTFGGLALLLLVRGVERPLCGLRRPVTPRITRAVCCAAFRILGMGHAVTGRPMAGHGALVANHASWLDIFALNACDLIYFVAKAEVARWPGIGWLARATGTLFIARDPREAERQTRQFRDRLDAGHRLMFFPEGTSTDGRRVLPFKTTLFAAFFAPHLRDTCAIQPVTLVYGAPDGAHPAFYGWWGEMGFGPHLLKVLAERRPGRVEVIFHDPIPVAATVDRKALAQRAEAAVRGALDPAAPTG